MVVPITCGKRELVGEGDTKMSGIGWPKTSPACGVWRASPLFLTRARARARIWLTRTGQDQGAAWHDGGEVGLSPGVSKSRYFDISISIKYSNFSRFYKKKGPFYKKFRCDKFGN